MPKLCNALLLALAVFSSTAVSALAEDQTDQSFQEMWEKSHPTKNQPPKSEKKAPPQKAPEPQAAEPSAPKPKAPAPKAEVADPAHAHMMEKSPEPADEPAKKWFENIEITAGITAAVQGTSGNNDPNDATASDDADYSHSVDIEFASEIEPGQRVVVALESGHSDGLNDNIGTSTFRPFYDPYSTVIADSNHKEAVTVSAAYYEGTFYEGALMLMAGKMDCHSMIDQNAFANDETTQFLGGPFVRQAGALYPELGKQGQYYANGLMLMLMPSDLFDVTLMAANPEASGLGEHGHIAGQLTLKPKLLGMDGNYRFYYLNDYRDFQNIKDGSISSSNGMGVSFDQFISDDIGIFFRYGTQNAKGQVLDADGVVADIDPLESVISGGFQFGGGLWGCKDDAAGIGYASGTMKPDLKTALETSLGGSLSGDQSMIEVYYRWQVSPKMGITPDIQFHSNMPRLEKRSLTAFALRVQLDF